MNSQNENKYNMNKIISYAKTGLIIGTTALFLRGCYTNKPTPEEREVWNRKEVLTLLENRTYEFAYPAQVLQQHEPELSKQFNITYNKIDSLEKILEAKKEEISNTTECKSVESKSHKNLKNFGYYILGLIGVGVVSLYTRDKTEN